MIQNSNEFWNKNLIQKNNFTEFSENQNHNFFASSMSTNRHQEDDQISEIRKDDRRILELNESLEEIQDLFASGLDLENARYTRTSIPNHD